MTLTYETAFDAGSRTQTDTWDASSVLSQHATDLAVTAGGGIAGGLTGWGSVAAIGGLERGGIELQRWARLLSPLVLGSLSYEIKARPSLNALEAASRELQAARTLPAIAIGTVIGGAIAYGGYRWLTDDKSIHKA